MKAIYIGAVLALLAVPAHALRVTNLDDVPHMVALEHAGATETRQIQPDETVQFPINNDGMLSLLSVKERSEGGTLNADGLLREIIGAVRTDNIPTVPHGRYVIWPSGKLMLQHNPGRYGGR